MLDRNELIAAKKEEIRSELAKWGEEHLCSGEQLVFELSLIHCPIVVESHRTSPDLLGMDIDQYFTPERCNKAGVDSKMYMRVYNCLLNVYVHDEDTFNTKRVKTVGDIASMGKHKLFMGKNLGKKSLKIIEAVFDHDGIQLSE